MTLPRAHTLTLLGASGTDASGKQDPTAAGAGPYPSDMLGAMGRSTMPVGETVADSQSRWACSPGSRNKAPSAAAHRARASLFKQSSSAASLLYDGRPDALQTASRRSSQPTLEGQGHCLRPLAGAVLVPQSIQGSGSGLAKESSLEQRASLTHGAVPGGNPVVSGLSHVDMKLPQIYRRSAGG